MISKFIRIVLLGVSSIFLYGGSSEVLADNYSTDDKSTTIRYNLNPSTFTNGEVRINVSAIDNEGGAGVENITLPNGVTVSERNVSYAVSKNGLYTFKSSDTLGNKSSLVVNVKNIDKNKPNVEIMNNTDWTNQNVEITINATDT